MTGQMADPGAFLAEVDQLEVEAEGMRNFVSRLDAEPVDGRIAQRPGGMVHLAPTDQGKLADAIKLTKADWARLFADDRIEMFAQILDFLTQDVTHGKVPGRFRAHGYSRVCDAQLPFTETAPIPARFRKSSGNTLRLEVVPKPLRPPPPCNADAIAEPSPKSWR